MPLCDGFDATRHIRDRGHLHVPIVAVTANASAEDEEKVRAACTVLNQCAFTIAACIVMSQCAYVSDSSVGIRLWSVCWVGHQCIVLIADREYV